MYFYQILSSDAEYDLKTLLMNAHEQQPQSFKERLFDNSFNALYIFKKNDKVMFIFGSSYQTKTLKTNLKYCIDDKMIFEDTEYIKRLTEFKYARNIIKKDENVNIYNDDMANLFKVNLDEIPEDVLISIKFKRSEKFNQMDRRLNKLEKRYREENRKTSRDITYMNEVASRMSQLNYLYDVEFQLCVKEKNKANDILLLSYYNHLKIFCNNNVNKISIDNFYSNYIIDDFNYNNLFVLEELEKFIYIPSLIDFKDTDMTIEEMPFFAMEQTYYIPKDDEFNHKDGVNMGKIAHPLIKDRYIMLDPAVLAQHMLTTGQTGSGKTADVLARAKSYIPEIGKIKHGFLYLDPKRMGAIKLLNHFLFAELMGIKVDWSRVHYIDLKSGIYIPQLNMLQKVSYRSTNQIIDRTLENFKDVYNSGDTPNLDKILRNIIGSLVLGKEDATILDSIKLITDKEFKNKVTSKIPDDINRSYKTFWDTDISPSDYKSTINRLSLFQTDTMQRLYGLPKLDFDFVKWAKEGHVVIIDALDLSDNATTLLIGQITSLALEQIMDKSPVKGFNLIIDEGKRAQVNAIPKIAEMGRECGCWEQIATQDINLLKKEFTAVLSGVISNYKVGRHNTESAKKMAAILHNDIDAKTIQKLPDNTMILKTIRENGEQVKMKVTNDIPYWYLPNGTIALKDNDIQQNNAIKWTLEKARELEKNDWMHRDEIDKILLSDNKNIVELAKNTEVIQEGNTINFNGV